MDTRPTANPSVWEEADCEKLRKIRQSIFRDLKSPKYKSIVYCSMVVAAEEGTEGGQVEVRTEQMIAASMHKPTVKVWKHRRGGFKSKTSRLGLILGIWSAILGNSQKFY